MREIDPDGSGHTSYKEFVDYFGKAISGEADTSGMAATLGISQPAPSKPAPHPRWSVAGIQKALHQRMEGMKSAGRTFRMFDEDKR